jgi:hypothetical protein
MIAKGSVEIVLDSSVGKPNLPPVHFCVRAPDLDPGHRLRDGSSHIHNG